MVTQADPLGDPLNLSDCHAMAQVLAGHEYVRIAYYNNYNNYNNYNSGVTAGCSQLHKHIQFAPLPHNPLLDAYRPRAGLPWQYRVQLNVWFTSSQ
jgi:ATP adenylyltransferase/5',5'''-P-1,P-4-tetraphosphate phosphorylase II